MKKGNEKRKKQKKVKLKDENKRDKWKLKKRPENGIEMGTEKGPENRVGDRRMVPRKGSDSQAKIYIFFQKIHFSNHPSDPHSSRLSRIFFFLQVQAREEDNRVLNLGTDTRRPKRFLEPKLTSDCWAHPNQLSFPTTSTHLLVLFRGPLYSATPWRRIHASRLKKENRI